VDDFTVDGFSIDELGRVSLVEDVSVTLLWAEVLANHAAVCVGTNKAVLDAQAILDATLPPPASTLAFAATIHVPNFEQPVVRSIGQQQTRVREVFMGKKRFSLP
jgi:hypothetical protein